MTWKEFLPNKTGYEVFKIIAEKTKAGKLTPEQAQLVWKLHKEINEKPEAMKRKKILDKLF